MRFHYAQALAGLGRFEEARKLAEEAYRPPDALDREALLRHLAVMAKAQERERNNTVEDAQTKTEPSFEQAEECQARGDLRGAARIYRKGGAALRRCFAETTAEGVKVDGPDFIIIGAPRSGSSWLKNSLKRHPQLRIATGEPSYFSSHVHLSPAVYAKRLSLVDPEQFSDAAIALGAAKRRFGRPIFGEKTPEYLTISDDAIELCAALYPKLRLICVVREPIARAWSHLKHTRLAAREARFYADADGKTPKWLTDILECGRYKRHLKRWARHFPAPQFLIIDFERISTDPVGLLDTVQEFLGADRVNFSNMALTADNLVGATAEVAPTAEIEAMLAAAYRGEIYDAAALRRSIEAAAPGDESRAA